MNFIKSIIRKATRTKETPVNILAFLSDENNRAELESTGFDIFYKLQSRFIDIDLVITDNENLTEAANFSMQNHVSLLIWPLDNLIPDIIRAVEKPYLNHEN